MSRSVDYDTPVESMTHNDLIENIIAFHKAEAFEMTTEELRQEFTRLRVGASQVFDDDDQCRRCGTYDEVHSCWKCDVYLCIECDPSEMRSGEDGHTYCHEHGPEEDC